MDDRVEHLQSLLSRLEAANERLEAATDATAAADILAEINDVAQAVGAEVERQRRAVQDDGPDVTG